MPIAGRGWARAIDTALPAPADIAAPGAEQPIDASTYLASERSIVVLTADHGEMLGEDGRWGHAYFMFPPILRVPLIMHVPADVRAQSADPGAISFLTDVSPTLYALLGYRPKPSNPLMGEPLLGPDAVDPMARRRGVYVLSASYSAVYAAVRRNGRVSSEGDCRGVGPRAHQRPRRQEAG